MCIYIHTNTVSHTYIYKYVPAEAHAKRHVGGTPVGAERDVHLCQTYMYMSKSRLYGSHANGSIYSVV
jgi:hypothetical protein